jgi:hypothetical protein
MDRANGAGECRDWYPFYRVSPDLRDRALGIRAAIALKCDAHREGCRPRFT